MKKYILLFLILVPFLSQAQETAFGQISYRTFGRYYVGAFNRIVTGLYNGIQEKNVTFFKDEALLKSYTFSSFQETHALKQKTKMQVERDGKNIEIDTTFITNPTWEWLWGFKKINANLYALYIQKPGATQQKGELAAYIDANDMKKVCGDFEWKLLNEITADGKLGNRQGITDIYFNKFKNIRGDIWNAALSGKISVYQNMSMITKVTPAQLKEQFKLANYINVVPDSLHREYDYQEVKFTEFPGDSVQGLGIMTKNKIDMSGTVNVGFYAISPLYDPSNTGGDYAMVDFMCWMKWEEVSKLLKPADVNYINELMFLFVSERMNSDCAY